MIGKRLNPIRIILKIGIQGKTLSCPLCKQDWLD